MGKPVKQTQKEFADDLRQRLNDVLDGTNKKPRPGDFVYPEWQNKKKRKRKDKAKEAEELTTAVNRDTSEAPLGNERTKINLEEEELNRAHVIKADGTIKKPNGHRHDHLRDNNCDTPISSAHFGSIVVSRKKKKKKSSQYLEDDGEGAGSSPVAKKAKVEGVSISVNSIITKTDKQLGGLKTPDRRPSTVSRSAKLEYPRIDSVARKTEAEENNEDWLEYSKSKKKRKKHEKEPKLDVESGHGVLNETVERTRKHKSRGTRDKADVANYKKQKPSKKAIRKGIKQGDPMSHTDTGITTSKLDEKLTKWNLDTLGEGEVRKNKFLHLMGAGKSVNGFIGTKGSEDAADISKMEAGLKKQYDTELRMKQEGRRHGLGR